MAWKEITDALLSAGPGLTVGLVLLLVVGFVLQQAGRLIQAQVDVWVAKIHRRGGIEPQATPSEIEGEQ